jgi:uncharacterized protein YecE (DUF72 family)
LPGIDTDRELSSRLSHSIRLGTSTWTFPGWRGIFYPKSLPEKDVVSRGLGLYARNPLFRTVGIDRSFYAPLTALELARYRDDLPDGYPCVMKVWSGVVTRQDPKTGAILPTFLEPRVFEQNVLEPVARSFAQNLGVFLLVLSPMRKDARMGEAAFVEALDRFFEAAPRSFRYAVELRNPELLTPSYLDVLSRHGVSHVLSSWERMPSVGRQLLVRSILTAPFCVCRLSIRPGERYDERFRAFSPFDRLVEVDEEMRASVVALARRCLSEKRELFVIVNNKMEGSAPLTVRALAERIVREGAA